MRDYIWNKVLEEIEKKYNDNIKLECSSTGLKGINKLFKEYQSSEVVIEKEDPTKKHSISFGAEDMD